MTNDVTVVYYTSNREKPEFEQKIRDSLLKTIRNIPLISVSQKPIPDFGKNICVGDVGVSEFNLYRQLYLGCREAKTKFICTAESDCLYPPAGYFDFKPPDGTAAYFNTNICIYWKNTDYFKRKGYSLCAMFTNREYILARLKKSLDFYGKEWISTMRKIGKPLFFHQKGWTSFKSELSVINIKTGDGTRWNTGTYGEYIKELPYWGSAIELGAKLWPDT